MGNNKSGGIIEEFYTEKNKFFNYILSGGYQVPYRYFPGNNNQSFTFKVLSSFSFSTFEDVDCSSLKNYGIPFPNNIIHEILLNLLPCDILRMYVSCKVFYQIGNTTVFWKRYLENIKKRTKISTLGEWKGKLNPKQEFFELFSNLDHYYDEKYKRLKLKDINLKKIRKGFFEMTHTRWSSSKMEIDDSTIIYIIGNHLTGKRNLAMRYCTGLFDEEDLNMDYFKVGTGQQTCLLWKNKENETENPKKLFLKTRILSDNPDGSWDGVLGYSYFFRRVKSYHCIILCFSFGNCDNKGKLTQEVLTEDENDFDDLLKLYKEDIIPSFSSIDCTRYSDGTKPERPVILLVGCKIDNYDGEDEDLEKMRKRIIHFVEMEKDVVGYIECSSKFDINICTVFGLLMDEYSPNFEK